MLCHTADAHDRTARLAGTGRVPAGAGPAGEGAREGRQPYRIAIVGSGPRGLAVAERIAARLAADPPDRDVEITLIDKVQVGAGRIWRTEGLRRKRRGRR